MRLARLLALTLTLLCLCVGAASAQMGVPPTTGGTSLQQTAPEPTTSPAGYGDWLTSLTARLGDRFALAAQSWLMPVRRPVAAVAPDRAPAPRVAVTPRRKP
ncbi:MAG: hypothetical protein HZC42_14325 [Candidatus Eisenbacteria bacterium]|nr:hypothetical protein [Candidatus Eisenbacteria bacterium]